jgi:hypothetical protein
LVDGRRVFFDYNDGYDILEEGLACDIYYKRSLLGSAQSARVLPLGLHFNYSYFLARLLLRRGFFSNRNMIEVLLSADFFRLSNMSHFDMRVSDVFGAPSGFGGRVIFFTRLWDPSRNADSEEKERRERMNKTRIELVRALRRGGHALSGIYPDEYAKQVCPDVLLDKSQTTKMNYMRALRSSDIGIANEGLKGAPGWKIGEYASGAKAIITNQICSVVPGFREGENYLNFDDPKSVPDLIEELRTRARYRQMQEANFEYSNSRLHPKTYLRCLLSEAF